ncbi:hypothetical protein GCM10022253_02190 [Sphingomonas endophytica]|uniref:DUF4398 domain-containing protein n=1 Tax=Sphingomonas endophytica TaxID=869719 RepID=A0ABR6N3J4_9SPHN|nr:hypothetical protein [Sphingomonas endophytica]MBB5725371.1 hypothetical protein [Sphingomonas endophytica]
MLRALIPPASFALLAACASDPTVYPSLAPRPVEKLGFAEPATPPPAPAAQDPALDAKLIAVTARGDAAARDFDRATARAATLTRAARGAKVGSDAWIAAQTAIADLDALRSSYGDTVGALDDLASTRAAALQPAYPALEQALAAARAAAEAQTARIHALAGALPGA